MFLGLVHDEWNLCLGISAFVQQRSLCGEAGRRQFAVKYNRRKPAKSGRSISIWLFLLFLYKMNTDELEAFKAVTINARHQGWPWRPRYWIDLEVLLTTENNAGGLRGSH